MVLLRLLCRLSRLRLCSRRLYSQISLMGLDGRLRRHSLLKRVDLLLLCAPCYPASKYSRTER